MKKKRTICVLLSLILMISLTPFTAYADDEPYNIFFATKDDDDDGSKYIYCFCIMWIGERDDILLSDVTDIRLTRDGSRIDVQVQEPVQYPWSNDRGESGVGFRFDIGTPLRDEGLYELSFAYQGRSYTATPRTLLQPILISNESELRAFADRINSTPMDYTNWVQIEVKLTQDIELTGEWTPIGRYEGMGDSFTEYAFVGTFDGCGHSITGVRIGSEQSPSTLEAIGFFGIARCHIKNLSLDVEIYARRQGESPQSVSGLALNSSGSIENCSVTGTINTVGSYIVGGITGECTNVIRNSRCSASITTSDAGSTGGITGILRNAYLEEVNGKMVITPGNAVIENCEFSGKITAQGSADCTGGIAGQSSHGAEIRGSRSTGDVSGVIRTGGLIGRSAVLIVRDSYATGNVSGTMSVGGLIGEINYGYFGDYERRMKDDYPGSIVENCYAAGDVYCASFDGVSGGMAGGFIGEVGWAEYDTLIIRGCHATGNVAAAAGYDANAGGFIATVNIFTGAIENCYATGNVTSCSAGGFFSKSSSLRWHYENGVLTQRDGLETTGTLLVSRCFASGAVSASSTVVSVPGRSEPMLIRGCAGGFSPHNGVNIRECAAFGDVNADWEAVGFASSYNNSVNSNAVQGHIERCWAAGSVTAVGATAQAAYAFGDGPYTFNCFASGNAGGGRSALAFDGGRNNYFSGNLTGSGGNFAFRGLNNSAVNCYGDMTVCPAGYSGGQYGKTTAEMQSPQFVDLLSAGQADSPWMQVEGGYPVLASVQIHNISVREAASNGSVTASTDRALEGNIIMLNIEPDEGYQLNEVTVNGMAITGSYFAMPDGAAVVIAEFEPITEEVEETQPSDGGDGSQDSSNTQNTDRTQTPDDPQTPIFDPSGDSNSDNPKEPINPAIYIGGGVVLLCLIAALVLFLISRKSKQNEERE